MHKTANRFSLRRLAPRAVVGAAFALVPLAAFAAGLDTLKGYMTKLTQLIIEPLVLLIFALAMYFLVSGAMDLILKADDQKARETGRRVLLWGVVGLFIMVSAVAILQVVTNTFCQNQWCIGG